MMRVDRESDQRAEAAAGREAKNALALVGAHMDRLRAVALEQIISSHPEHVALRERMIVTAQIIDGVRAALEKSVLAGDNAQHSLAMAETVGFRR